MCLSVKAPMTLRMIGEAISRSRRSPRTAESEGVGQSLLRAAEKWSKGIGFSRVALDVFASNSRGQRFYETAGFRAETIRVSKRL